VETADEWECRQEGEAMSERNDCQGEDPIMILVEWLRQSARLSTDTEAGETVEKNVYWRSADALLSLFAALSTPIQGITLGPRIEGKLTEQEALELVNASRLFLLAGARAALHKDHAA
jgi:hypothetical protein